MTALEIAHSRRPEEAAALVDTMRSKLPKITSFTYSHRTRLVKPMLSYDLAAVSIIFSILSFPFSRPSACDCCFSTYLYEELDVLTP